jgi:hypothetical protein
MQRYLAARLAFALILLLAIASPAIGAGPFGFEKGMTREQVVKLVRDTAVTKVTKGSTEDITILTLNTAPKPHPDIEDYMLLFSSTDGLLKIVASRRTIRTNGFGSALRDAFLELRDAVAGVYGNPKTFDFLESGSIWKEPEDWMMGLLKQERHLIASWEPPPTLPSQIADVEVEAVALSTEAGYVAIRYEFNGFAAFMEAQKKKAATVF